MNNLKNSCIVSSKISLTFMKRTRRNELERDFIRANFLLTSHNIKKAPRFESRWCLSKFIANCSARPFKWIFGLSLTLSFVWLVTWCRWKAAIASQIEFLNISLPLSLFASLDPRDFFPSSDPLRPLCIFWLFFFFYFYQINFGDFSGDEKEGRILKCEA